MAHRTLGLDLGSNSLGWAILDDDTLDILDKGVVIFPEGMDLEETSSVNTPSATRRTARMSRRMKFRRKLRKWALLKLLIKNKMCPLTEKELLTWKQTGTYPLENKEFIKWLKATDTDNPYCDRNAAANGPVAPHVLGRALYHLCQRRGFKSSRKDLAGSNDDTGLVKGDIKNLTAEIEYAGCQTLGQYFYKCLEENKNKICKTRIRKRYTGRIEHYEKEFEVIMDQQGKNIEKSLRDALHEAIFLQRPLRSQKYLVGKCPLEPKCPRAQIGHPAFEEFRMRAFVNNLSLEDKNGNWQDEQGGLLYPLTREDRDKICEKVQDTEKSTFKSLYKLFKKDERFIDYGLRFRKYNDDDLIPSCPIRHKIKAAFGEVPFDEQKVFDALTFFDDDDKLRAWFKAGKFMRGRYDKKDHPTLPKDAIEKLIKINPPQGNAKYSLKAINRILPYLRAGYDLSFARFCAKLGDIIPDFETHKEEIIRNLEERRFQYQTEKREYAKLSDNQRKLCPVPQRLSDRWIAYLQENVDPNITLSQFYSTTDDVYTPETFYYNNKHERIELKKPRLPKVELGMIRNPLVQRSMTTLRRLVNYLSDHNKIDFNDTIHIELARSVNDFATRQAWKKWQEERRKLREEAVKEIESHHKQATDDAIERYILWKEQDCKCLYTGKTITIADLLNGNKFDIEHTIPRSLSGNDALTNKTICDAKYNRDTKKGQVPRNCPNWSEIDAALRPWREKRDDLEKLYIKQKNRTKGITDPKRKSDTRIKALVIKFELNYWREKIANFERLVERHGKNKNEGSGFMRRQLVDTGIMTKHAVTLLKCLYSNTYGVNGSSTAFARKAWGIQEVDSKKDRSEHSHHAKDAMVIAALTPKRFNTICAALKDDGADYRRECDICPPPSKDFAEKVRQATGEILVKHVLRQTTTRQSSKRTALAKAHPLKKDPSKIVKYVLAKGDTVRGQLHKDSFYGCIKDSNEELRKVIRKPLIGPIKQAEGLIEKIVDPAIRDCVWTAIDRLKAQDKKNIEPNEITMPSGVPINKVRVFADNAREAHELRSHPIPSAKDYKTPYYVTSAPGSNFRLALFKDKTVRVENALDWAQQHKRDAYTPYDQMPGFIGYIKPGIMALTHTPNHPEELYTMSPAELSKRLYKVVKFSSEGQTTFLHHLEARASTVLDAYLKEKYNGKNVQGFSQINLAEPYERLRVGPCTFSNQMLFEGIHFNMLLNGEIKWLKDKIVTLK